MVDNGKDKYDVSVMVYIHLRTAPDLSQTKNTIVCESTKLESGGRTKECLIGWLVKCWSGTFNAQ